ncbi:WXG100 family type VII secretion target [Actinokineospora sp. HUAS TT18]|uniref:WXG100 family type VII secretion target n=1 Tax=Actinokineospora sp. HUAS TT18 TaxID=3447451 RepID=UPI003F527095
MTGTDVSSGVLLGHAEGSTKQSDNFTGLASLLEQARVHDECFGPLGEVMAFKYFDSLQECQDMATKASSYLEQIAEALKDTAKAYGDTDTENATGLTQASQGVGSLGDLNGAGNGTRDGYFGQVANYGSSWADAADKLQDAGSPVEAGFALFNARMEQLNTVMSPGQAFVDNGLGFLISLAISPIVNFVLEPAIGDPEQMKSTAKGWDNVSKWLDGVAEHEKTRAEATSQGWQGEAGDAFRREMGEFSQGAKALSGDVSGLKDILETAATIFETFVQIVVDIIQEFVIGLIIEWLAALAASWITAGASVAAATGLTSAQIAITSTRLGTKVANLMHKLKPLITKLEDILQMIRQNSIAKAAIQKIDKATKIPLIGKTIGRQLDGASPVLGAIRNHGDDLLTTSPNNIIGKAVTGEQALAQRVVRTGLGYLGVSGTTVGSTVVIRGTLENLPGAAAEWGAKQVENHVEDPSSSEERKADQERGFTID